MYDFTPIINVVIVLLATLITAFVIPWLKSKKTSEEITTVKETVEVMVKWAIMAVQTAEIIFEGSGQGSYKKSYVLDWVRIQCEKANITFDPDVVSTMIEQAGENLGLWGTNKTEG